MRRIFPVILLAIFLLTGCDSVGLSIGGSYFSLPKRSDEYVQLGTAIENEIQDAEYSPPVSGYNRQAIQMEDLDGDGEKEAVVFLVSKVSGLLRLCIFKNTGETYEVAASTEFEGTAFDSIRYDDFEGNGKLCIVVGSSLGNGLLKALTVYSLTEEGLFPLLTNTYTGYTVSDLTGDVQKELVLVRHDASTLTGVVEIYRKTSELKGLSLDAVAPLSQNVEELRRLRTGLLIGEKPAVFVAGVVSSGNIITDIFAYNRGQFQNITADENTGISDGTIRKYDVYAADLTGNGLMEIPRTVELPPFSEMQNEVFFKNVWRNYDVDGKYVEVMETYHNYTDGWYLILPEPVLEGLVIERREYTGGERAISFRFKVQGAEAPAEVFAIYTLTGDNREERTSTWGRIPLPLSRLDAAFAVTLSPLAKELGIDAELIAQNFKLIQTEWTAGEIVS